MQTFNNVQIIDRADHFETIAEGPKKGHNILSRIVITTKHGDFHIQRDFLGQGRMSTASAELGKRQIKKILIVNGNKIVDWR